MIVHMSAVVNVVIPPRLYVVSRLPQLQSLDMSPVTDDERAAAARTYGTLTLKIVSRCIRAAAAHDTQQGAQKK